MSEPDLTLARCRWKQIHRANPRHDSQTAEIKLILADLNGFRSTLSAEEVGFEPTVSLHPQRFSRPDHELYNVQQNKELREVDCGGVPRLVPSRRARAAASHLPPDLERVVGAWESLPAPIRAAILTLVEASVSGRE